MNYHPAPRYTEHERLLAAVGRASWSPDYTAPPVTVTIPVSDPRDAFAFSVAEAARNLKPGQTLTVQLNDRFGLEPAQPYGFITIVDVVAGEPD